MTEQTVGDLGEFGLIARVTRGRAQPAGTLLGPGDDAAVLAVGDGRVVVSTDVLVQDVHFRMDWSSPEQIGRKAAAVNLADIAAMGAVPTALLVGFGCPPRTPVDTAEGVVAGLWAEAGRVGAGVVGGDVVSAPGLVIAVTVLGSLAGRAAVTRAGARPGDVLALAGRLGWSAAGLAALRGDAAVLGDARISVRDAALDAGARTAARASVRDAGARDAVLDTVLDAHRVPDPPYQAGPAAAAAGATAMIDVSDGLLADVGHLAAASGVAVDVRSAALPMPPVLTRVAALLGADPMHWLLTGGEDHALVATFPEDRGLPAGWLPIGLVAEGAGVSVDGAPYPGVPGWHHFTT